ncbi:hypothetical protein [Phenylobacterium koreense]|uniref:Spy/CpxP family protein refolding chaperone n=1 Tax=Phenylobacterium koreense TaxID=266125 RepID=A0ABV2EMX2_9CAUL
MKTSMILAGSLAASLAMAGVALAAESAAPAPPASAAKMTTHHKKHHHHKKTAQPAAKPATK